jgi:voltage-gated potassium channel
VRGRLRYALTPLLQLDLVSIAPSYIEMLGPDTIDLRFLRVLRLLRMFRLVRMQRVSDAVATLSRAISSKRAELAITMALVVVMSILAAGAMYFVERDVPGTHFTSIPRAMWWSIVTITTVGYGDVTPATSLGQITAGVVAFIGICTLALPVGILSSAFIEQLNRDGTPPAEPRTCPHCQRLIG